MGLARFGVNKPVPVNLLMAALLIGGGVAAWTLQREFFPGTDPLALQVVNFDIPRFRLLQRLPVAQHHRCCRIRISRQAVATLLVSHKNDEVRLFCHVTLACLNDYRI